MCIRDSGITEKSYQQYAIKEIITYLTTHNYPQMISPKVMHSPDTRTYLSIAGFLLRQYDANMSFDCAPRAKGAGGPPGGAPLEPPSEEEEEEEPPLEPPGPAPRPAPGDEL